MTADAASLVAPAVDGFDAAKAVARGLHDAEPVPRQHKVRRCLAHLILRWMMLIYGGLLVVASAVGRCRPGRRGTRKHEIVVTGTFYSDNWIVSHLRPLAASTSCSRLWVVSTYPMPSIPKVVAVTPPRWLQRLAGAVPARLAAFSWTVLRRRPDIIGGFHLLVNGLVTAVVARLVGARSMYFCVGGPMEVIDGGIWAENRIFGQLETPDPVVEARLIRSVAAFDLVITMGTRAAAFFRNRGIRADFHVVPGGIEPKRFTVSSEPPTHDLILVGRLAEIKRVDVFLNAVKHVLEELPDTTAVIVGDGDQRHRLEALARSLGVDHNVKFVGHRPDVNIWLRRARLFVLTSDSEGLALSLMEAMTCGLAAVVSNVGDLADLVEEGVTGYLVEPRSPQVFAARIVSLLRDPRRLASFSQASRRAALRHDTNTVTKRWDAILENLA